MQVYAKQVVDFVEEHRTACTVVLVSGNVSAHHQEDAYCKTFHKDYDYSSVVHLKLLSILKLRFPDMEVKFVSMNIIYNFF